MKKSWFGFFWLSIFLIPFLLKADAGRIKILSKELIADSPGELLLAYQAGKEGLKPGDELRIQLPGVWYNQAGCPRIDRIIKFQSKDPDKNGYFGVRSAPKGVVFSTRNIFKKDIYGDSNRFVQVLVFSLNKGELQAGQEVVFCFRHLVKNHTPWLPRLLGSGEVLAQLRRAGQTFWISSEEIKMEAGSPAQILITLPSVIYPGEQVEAKIRLLDKNYNLVKNWKYYVKLSSSSGCEVEPMQVRADASGVARAEVLVEGKSCQVQGFYPGLKPAQSNYLLVLQEGTYRVFWGDVHSHSQFSHDGMGIKPFEYARDASALDFYALTEHIRAISEREWEQIQKWVKEYNQPGKFITILAYENSTLEPSGHHNVYFEGEQAPHPITDNLKETWEEVGKLNPIIIQHHLGIGWIMDLPGWAEPLIKLFNRAFGCQVNWGKYAQVPRPALEIYSGHGQSEYYNPQDPLSYENCDLILEQGKNLGFCTTGYSQKGAHYARDAWAEGLKLGVVAGSDDHRAQPGKNPMGLTAVLAKNLTRQEIMEAIREHRTYATTGERIYLDFRVNGKIMGSDLKIPKSSLPEIYLKILGTHPLKYVEALAYDFASQSWREVKKINPDSNQIEQKFIDRNFSGKCLYYLRLEQKNRVAGRPVRAWSSPVWVETE